MTTTRPRDERYLVRLPDGTTKARNPFTGTQVWTVPGRGDRPLAPAVAAPRPVAPGEERRLCAFCEDRTQETPPERARVVRRGSSYETVREPSVAQTLDGPAELRRVPNLFEILSFDYWRANHGHALSAAQAARRSAWLADPRGRARLLGVARARALAAGRDPAAWDAMPEADRLAGTDAFFGGGHDVVVARRHLVDGATDTGALASAGTLSVDEHRAYVALTVDTLRELYALDPAVRYVAAFQNWLRPAGASFDHLHKQVVAVDELGTQAEQELARVADEPDLFARLGPELAARHGLVIAHNAHALAFAGIGHRYPTVEVWSRSRTCEPWLVSPAERDGLADLLHAVHAATGPEVPTNEEWHHRPPGVDAVMPWRVLVKWRVSTLAGFEGGTKIYVGTIDPWALRERVVERLRALRAQGRLADGIQTT